MNDTGVWVYQAQNHFDILQRVLRSSEATQKQNNTIINNNIHKYMYLANEDLHTFFKFLTI